MLNKKIDVEKVRASVMNKLQNDFTFHIEQYEDIHSCYCVDFKITKGKRHRRGSISLVGYFSPDEVVLDKIHKKINELRG